MEPSSEATVGNNMQNGLLESIWKSFKQTFESSSFISSSSKPGGDKATPHLSGAGKTGTGPSISRRVLLMEQTLKEHYTTGFIESSPHLEKYISQNGASDDDDGASDSGSSSMHSNNGSKHKPLRWKRQERGKQECYYYSERKQSHWSFQWCPQDRVYQGRRNNDWSLNRGQSLGRFVELIDDRILIAFVKDIHSKYPQAKLEAFHRGAPCIPTHGARSSLVPPKDRISVVAIHEDGSSYCGEYVANGDLAEGNSIVAKVEEPKLCTYIFHVCAQPSTRAASNTIEEKPTKDLKEASLITESDAKEFNESMQRIREVMHIYLHRTKAEINQKSKPDRTSSLHAGLPPLPPSRIETNLQLVKDMFIHAYDSYMQYAYPASEIKPMTCEPAVFDPVKIPALTLIDALDTLVLLGNFTEFARSVERLRALNREMAESGIADGGLFALNRNVSVFETNIRVLGGLLSAHQLAESFLPRRVLESDVWGEDSEILMGSVREEQFFGRQDLTANPSKVCTESILDCQESNLNEEKTCNNQTDKFWVYDGCLLELAQDIGDRLLPAFQTRTGIPYGTVNLLNGIPKGETTIASLAGGGTLSLEMELLSKLTGNPEYGRAAKLSARALWMRRSKFNLLGKHICTQKGQWTESLSGIGSNSDSFYEYLIKHYILFPEDHDFWFQMVSAYGGVHNESRLGEWYGDVDLNRGLSAGGGARNIFEALMAFYPGMQVLLGELTPAARSLNSFFLVREFLGFLPERFDFGSWKVDSRGGKHLLRPELLESAYFLHRSSKGFQQQFRWKSDSGIMDSSGWQWAADFALHTLERMARTRCGYASLHNLSPTTTGALGEHDGKTKPRLNEMPSYFLSETLKYLYLTFDEFNILHTDGDHDWVFTTEAHPIYHPKPLNTKEEISKLEELKQRLIDRLETRAQGKESVPESTWHVLDDEKWTRDTSLRLFMQHIEPIASQMDEVKDLRMDLISKSQHGVLFLQNSHIVEPFLTNEQIYANLDYFNQTQKKLNAAHLTFRKMGNAASITKACPNFYVSDFLWMRALNGGATDYADIYMTSAHDHGFRSENKFLLLGSVDALSLHGTGAHVTTLYDEGSHCTLTMESKPTRRSKTQNPSSTDLVGKDRFDMGGDLGEFEVSAFPGGSGFYIQQTRTKETLVTTLIEDISIAGDVNTYVMVYSNPTYTHQGDEVISEDRDPWSSENEGSSFAEIEDNRSVMMADLKGNTYKCQIDVLTVTLSSGQQQAPTNSEKVLASYPCAPALFGPTHMSELITSGGILVEAPLRAPESGEDYGCGDPDPVANDDAVLPPNSFSQSSSKEGEANVLDQTCKTNVVQLVKRGVCTFQEKAMNQKKLVRAEAVITINSDSDELFVMSGGGVDDPEYSDHNNFPATVLVTGSDGQNILDIMGSFENEDSNLFARVSLIRDEIKIVEESKTLKVNGNNHWPAVHASSEALQVFARGGWGVHAVQQKTDGAKTLEWKLFLMRHES